MSLNIDKAADTFAYYIELALEKAGEPMSGEMWMELNDARNAFHEAARELDHLRQLANAAVVQR